MFFIRKKQYYMKFCYSKSTIPKYHYIPQNVLHPNQLKHSNHHMSKTTTTTIILTKQNSSSSLLNIRKKDKLDKIATLDDIFLDFRRKCLVHFLLSVLLYQHVPNRTIPQR